MYEFSAPMPFEFEHIDKLVETNNKVTKSKITSLYFGAPRSCYDLTGFESLRTHYDKYTSFEYWAERIVYSKEQGFDFVYLLNNPRAMTDIDKVLDMQLKQLDKLMNNLRKIGCKKIRVANIQLLNYILKMYPDMEIYASTTLEFNQIQQFQVFFDMYPSVKEIVPSFEANKNFKMLANLRNQFSSFDIELITNEGCLSGCPSRIQHCISIPYLFTKNDLFSNRDEVFTSELYLKKCMDYSKRNLSLDICKNKLIFPWEIEEYVKIGVNKFKLVGRNCDDFNNGKYMSSYEIYLTAIEDYDKVKDFPFSSLSHHFKAFGDFVTIDMIRKYLPKIEYFIKNGHLCSSMCGSECTYCYDCAKELDKVIKFVEEKKSGN